MNKYSNQINKLSSDHWHNVQTQNKMKPLVLRLFVITSVSIELGVYFTTNCVCKFLVFYFTSPRNTKKYRLKQFWTLGFTRVKKSTEVSKFKISFHTGFANLSKYHGVNPLISRSLQSQSTVSYEIFCISLILATQTW